MENKPSIQELIDKALERKGDRVRSGKYSPSSLGRCYRAQYWNRKDEPVSNPAEDRVLRVFKAGDLFHEFVQDVIIANNPEAKKEVLIETEDFKGYADLVLEDEVVDLKSQHSRAFWYRSKLTWNELEPNLLPNILQVVFYASNLGKDRARLVFISKDDLAIQEFPLSVGNYSLKLGEEIATLRDFWHYEALPPAAPRAYPDKEGKPAECKYCNWKDTCDKIEALKKEETNAAPKEK
jgi:hypothetical protein